MGVLPTTCKLEPWIPMHARVALLWLLCLVTNGPLIVVCCGCSLVMDVVDIEMYTTNVMARTEDGLIHVDLGEDNVYYYGR